MEEFIYRPAAAVWMGFALIFVILMIAGVDFFANGSDSFFEIAPLYLILVWFIGVFAIRPKVRVGKTLVTAVNPFRIITVPLDEVIDLETRRGLVLITARGKFPVAAAVAPGRHGVASANRENFKWASSQKNQGGEYLAPGDILDSDSGAVAFVVRQKLNEPSHILKGSAARTRTTITYSVPVIGSGILFFFWFLIQLFF